MTFVVVRLLHDRGIYQVRTDVLGAVELRPPAADLDDEAQAIRASRIAFGFAQPEVDVAMRAATLVETGSIQHAEATALERFEVAVDLLSLRASGLNRHDVTSVGFSRDLSNAHLAVSRPAGGPLPTTTFAVIQRAWDAPDLAQWLASRPPSDLGVRLLRGLRWKRLADLEPNRQLKLLFRWFAIEATLRLEREEDVVPWVLTFCGFPTGRIASVLDVTLRDELHAIPNYRGWRDQIGAELGQVRDYRHATVHAGFRPHDVPVDDLRRWVRLMSVLVPRVLHAVEAALGLQIEELAVMRRDAHLVLRARERLVKDLAGTVLHILAQPIGHYPEL